MTLVHRTWRLGLVAAALLLLAGAAISPALGAGAAGGAVSIVDKTFEPARIVVDQGDTVTWTVTKAVGEPHTVTSGTPTAADKGSVFDSQKDDASLTKLKDNGGTYSFTFDKAGTYPYFCVVHPTVMTGEVVVLAPGESAPPAASEPPAAEAHEPIPAERKLLSGGILVVTLILLFGAAWVWRRMNPA